MSGLKRRVDLVKDTPIPPERKLEEPVIVRIDSKTVLLTEKSKVSTKKKKQDYIDKFLDNVERSRKVYL